ncbi:cytochrome-c peroxidase [Malassezia brasiliensis]|uniref:Peroxidase n=1 Tax=Malassezia brasiliensis TaxID=1821822 RepID=A0AAF0DQ88_9BASI|nr:cytochrome-c peroxidase [Malassezia brasiliensis]
MVLFRSTNLLRSTRALPHLRAYSTEGPKRTINEASHNDTKKAGSNVGLIAFGLLGAVIGGVYFFSEDTKSSLAGGNAAGDKSIISQQKEGKMVTPFQNSGHSRSYAEESGMFLTVAMVTAALSYAFIVRDDFKFWGSSDISEVKEKTHQALDKVKDVKVDGAEKKEDENAASAAGATSAAANPSDDKLPTLEDYQKVYNRIAESLEDNDFDDGSYGPVVLRLSWHSSGTYDTKTKTGGSNGATMRFKKEASYDSNAGLQNARKFLEPIKEEFSWISYSDLWTLAGVCATQEMGGPEIPWRPGREDEPESETHADNLPDGTEDPKRLRSLGERLGFNDQELTALIGAHAMGRCHTYNSGYDGPWTYSPTSFTNAFYTELLDTKWTPRKWEGPSQYQNPDKQLMMLPSDYALFEDPKFKEYVKRYAESDDDWRKDFASVYSRLLELGVPEENFKKGAKGLGSDKPIYFRTLADQENEKEKRDK